MRPNIVRHLWDQKSGVLRLGDIAQDVNAYGISLGVSPKHDRELMNLQQSDHQLPPAFTGLGPRFDDLHLCSPYATGFALKAMLSRGEGFAARAMLRRVWGGVADEFNPNFSGCHWEAMAMDGEPYHNSTSLVHGWSTSPVYLLPHHLAGLQPLEPGWKHWEANPVNAGLTHVEVSMPTALGEIAIRWTFDEGAGKGGVTCTVPAGSRGSIYAPEAWSFGHDYATSSQDSHRIDSEGSQVKATLHRA